MLLTLSIAVCYLAAPAAGAGSQKYTPDELKEMLAAGFSNIERETINGPVTVDYGTVPNWLSGNFMRHACGAFGETDHETPSPNYIQHLFDCFEIGSKFRIHNGTVTFTNKWYDTVVNDIYNYYGRDMNKSSVFLTGTYSKANRTQIDKWQANMSASHKVQQVPHVSWWKIGGDAVAMSEGPIGVVVDPETVTQMGEIQYTDAWLGLNMSEGWSFINNPAHEQVDRDGTLYSTVGAYKFESRTQIVMKRIVYKVGADKYRHVVGEYEYNKIDLSLCQGSDPYPNFEGRLGYLHSFVMTENYIVLPEAAYLFNPCFMTHYDKYAPFFTQGFTFEKSAFSRILVLSKSDGHLVSKVITTPFFVTHQLGSYEEGNFIHMDMLMYDDAGIYDQHTYVNSFMNNNYYLTNVSRITIDTRDWSATIRNLRNGPPAAFEMSGINYAYSGRKYTFAYMAKNFDQTLPNAITKLNVDTGNEVDYTLEEGLFIQEPQFIARPSATGEDDGVLMAQGVDGRKKKAFLVIVDAKTMTLISHVTAPDLALFGIHERFYPLPSHGQGSVNIVG